MVRHLVDNRRGGGRWGEGGGWVKSKPYI